MPKPCQPLDPKDGRRSIGHFLSNVGRNLVGLFSTDSVKPLLVGAAAIAVASTFDDHAQRYFSRNRRAKWLGDPVDRGGQPRVFVTTAAILFGLGRLCSDRHQRFRDTTYDIAQAAAVEAICSTTIKKATRRLRPNGASYNSFPSGHTSNAFAWATLASRQYGPTAGVPAYVAATLIGVARMERNTHYLSDIVAGAILGYLVGTTVTRRDDECPPTPKRVGGGQRPSRFPPRRAQFGLRA
jgi:membrane-associated phospholipid phosphatase